MQKSSYELHLYVIDWLFWITIHECEGLKMYNEQPLCLYVRLLLSLKRLCPRKKTPSSMVKAPVVWLGEMPS
jgi:hypothetical protein